MFGFDVRDRDKEEERAWRKVWEGEAGGSAGGDEDSDTDSDVSPGEDSDSLWEAEVAVLAISALQRAAD